MSGNFRFECQDCGRRFRKHDDLHDVEDVLDRVSPGEIMPWGQCPECGALVHEIKVNRGMTPKEKAV